MRLVEYKRIHRLRDDAYCSDYMVLLDKLMKDINSVCADELAHRFDDPRESDIELMINGELYVLPLSFLSEMLNAEYFEGLIDNLHRGPDERIYEWPLDNTIEHPICNGCGKCKQKNRAFTLGTACLHEFVKVDPHEKHRKSCDEHFQIDLRELVIKKDFQKGDIELRELIVQDNGINAYIETWFDVDEKFSLDTKDSDTSVDFYALYNPDTNTLTCSYIVKEDIKSTEYPYLPTQNEITLIKAMMEETCMCECGCDLSGLWNVKK